MTTQELIEKAIEGGWGRDYLKSLPQLSKPMNDKKRLAELIEERREMYPCIEEMLLDVAVWQAISVRQNWPPAHIQDIPAIPVRQLETAPHVISRERLVPGYVFAMHRMIDALAEGQSLEQFINSL